MGICRLGGVKLSEGCRVFHQCDLLALQLTSTSKGNQNKWYFAKEKLYIKEQFFYQGKYWKDYLVEIIASELSKQMFLHGTKVVQQNECIIQGEQNIHAVYSSNFCDFGERDISLGRLDRGLEDEILDTKNIGERWELILEAFEKKTGVDYENYLIVMTILDYLVGNEDRHLNNICVIEKDGIYKEAPLFDFGLGLFEHDRKYEGESFRKCLKAGSYLLNRCNFLGIELRGVV